MKCQFSKSQFLIGTELVKFKKNKLIKKKIKNIMSKIIGIDLGTTNSCVAVMEGKKDPVVIQTQKVKELHHLLLHLQKMAKRKVGDPAKDKQLLILQKQFILSKDLSGHSSLKIKKKFLEFRISCSGYQMIL